MRHWIILLLFAIGGLTLYYFPGRHEPQLIASVPYVIKKPGVYRLKRDFFSEQDCLIKIVASDVSLDLNGYSLMGTGDWDKVQSGICGKNVRNIKIYNGGLNSFTYGILLEDDTLNKSPEKTRAIRIHDIRLINNTFRGIRVSGSHIEIKGNVIQRTGGFRLYKNGFSFGIETVGPYVSVLDNKILDTFPGGTGEGVGVSLTDYCDECKITGNLVANQEMPIFGRTFGVWIGAARPLQNLEISQNKFVKLTYAFNAPYHSEEEYLRINNRLENNTLVNVGCGPYTKHLYSLYPYKIRVNRIARNNTYIGSSDEQCADTEAYYLARFSDKLPEVQYRLAQIAKSRSMSTALSWYRKAAAQGFSEAQRILDILEK